MEVSFRITWRVVVVAVAMAIPLMEPVRKTLNVLAHYPAYWWLVTNGSKTSPPEEMRGGEEQRGKRQGASEPNELW